MKEHGAINERELRISLARKRAKKTHATHESANAPDANLTTKPTGETND